MYIESEGPVELVKKELLLHLLHRMMINMLKN